MSEYLDVLHRRGAAQDFQSSVVLSNDDLRTLVEEASLAPSSFNLQHCRFMFITRAELKHKIVSATLPANKQKVLNSSTCVLLLGDTRAHVDLAERLDTAVAIGTLTKEVEREWLGFVSNVYAHNREIMHDEIIRSCSLAAMIFMLSAANKGLDTCPIGFNAQALIRDLSIPDRYTPVILLALGKTAQSAVTRRPRRPVNDLLTIDSAPIP